MNHLTPIEQYRNLLIEAHANGAERGCASTQILIACYQSNGGNVMRAVDAAKQSFGGRHAPVIPAYLFWENCCKLFDKNEVLIEELVKEVFSSKHGIVPGYGSSFVKGKQDPTFFNINHLIKNNWQKVHYLLSLLTEMIHDHKPIYPNLALYTAIYFYLKETPVNFMEYELFMFRLPAWESILTHQYNQEQTLI